MHTNGVISFYYLPTHRVYNRLAKISTTPRFSHHRVEKTWTL